ncbi:MAG: Holliday junction resolvase RuvX [Alphaproteobacteria bacterium]|nr:Holliday junction resolvase RuvX [Alphaproteobacteria bacterium]
MPLVSLKELKALLPAGKRLAGIDQSKNALGIALSNPELTLATPLKTIPRKKFKDDVATLSALAVEYAIAGFVIGLPLNMDGSSGPRTDSVKHFADNLLKEKEALGFDPLITFFDERLSTHAAEQVLIDDLDLSRKKRAKVIDAQAAAQILQGTLDSL